MRSSVVAAVAALVAISVLASLGLGYFSGISTRETETMTSVGTSTVTSTFTHGILVPVSSASTLTSLTGLSLHLNLSTNANGQLVLAAYEFNTLDRINNVSYGSSWPNAPLWQWTEYDCSEGSMMGYEILQGNYAPNNYTQGMALWIHPLTIAQGGCELMPGNDSYSFEPMSVRSLVSGTYVGYWIEGETYTPFAPGTYTVLAGDQWGQVAMLRFVVAG